MSNTGPGSHGESLIAYGSPVSAESHVRLDDPAFAADPHRVYEDLRRHGPLVPIELSAGVPATLVIGYQVAVRILNDETHFPADSRRWEKNAAPGCPLLPMLGYRQNALRTAGAEHERYRRTIIAALETVDLHKVHDAVTRAAESLINSFCDRGSADLRMDYAYPLTFRVLSELLGFPEDAAAEAYQGMAAMLEGVGAEEGQQRFVQALVGVVQQKQAEPGDDLTSQLLRHPDGLDLMEMVNQAALLFSMGTEPTCNLILNALLLLMTDEEYGGEVLSGAMATRDAIDAVLFEDPPLANWCVSYPIQPQLVGDMWLPADQPVVISLAACNNDPVVGGDRRGNRSHLAWGAGPHACPAQSLALTIASQGIDLLLDALPDIRPQGPAQRLEWRPGQFHRALATLPVRFPACPPVRFA
ncbi:MULTISPECIES: cytochrome P450 family protein [Nocardia]|uniref:Cytochrome P450 n=1 Tax=Nocardia implantans TaxID=3108168 RepID=A0ABU6ARR9_9NOCA|nr:MULTISPECIES: cytochrome P450 [unclassified Nocardia]MEA3528070.1 cytochrome P450 [Nocardia sp. CDC192]MEB3510178.1 cytochrome P450 [Nocardia sp. CDC186]